MPTTRPSAKDRALAHVRDGVLSGRYPGGELLSEGEVAEELGLSRTPVREAFLLLEAEGLMRLYPKRGALVVPVSAAEVRDVMETRRLIEGHAAARVGAAAIAPDLARALAEALDTQAAAIAAGDGQAFVAADRLWHREIVAAAGNLVLLRLYDSLRDRQQRMVAVTVARAPGAAATYLDEHRAIGAALSVGEGERARALMEAHIDGARARLEE